MKFLTIEQIKAQLRLDDQQAELERDLLEMYGEAAEETVLDIIRRSLLDVIVTYNGIPTRLRQASLMLVAQSYQQREPSSTQNMSAVPYSFDLLVKPLMRLAGEDPKQNWEDSLPEGAIVSSDGRVLLDKDYRIVCAKSLTA